MRILFFHKIKHSFEYVFNLSNNNYRAHYPYVFDVRSIGIAVGNGKLPLIGALYFTEFTAGIFGKFFGSCTHLVASSIIWV